MSFNRNLVRTIDCFISPESVQLLRDEWRKNIAKLPAYPNSHYSGKGIVYCAGGIKYLSCLFVSLSTLRASGCSLPVEVWHLSDEVTEEVVSCFSVFNVSFRNFRDVGIGHRGGVHLKPLAILHSKFEEVLFMDADNVCLDNPGYLFEIAVYKDTGTIFWPDYWYTDRNNPIWEITGASEYGSSEQESGQLIVNKKECWKELNLCVYFNNMGVYYYKFLYGDKDTFRYAWLALKRKYYMIETYPATCGVDVKARFRGNTIVQFNDNGEFLFLHRNLSKWDGSRTSERLWKKIKKFNSPSGIREVLLLKSGDNYFIDFAGDLTTASVPTEIVQLEIQCLSYLKQWRKSKAYLSLLPKTLLEEIN